MKRHGLSYPMGVSAHRLCCCTRLQWPPLLFRSIHGGAMAPALDTAATARHWLGLTGLCVGVFMFTLDGSIVNVALPTLVKTLHTTFAMVQWVVVAYLLVATALVMAAAR